MCAFSQHFLTFAPQQIEEEIEEVMTSYENDNEIEQVVHDPKFEMRRSARDVTHEPLHGSVDCILAGLDVESRSTIVPFPEYGVDIQEGNIYVILLEPPL